VQTGNETDGFIQSHRLLANTPNRRQKCTDYGRKWACG